MKMSNIYGNYWAENQVVVKKIFDTDSILEAVYNSSIGTPAFLAVVADAQAFPNNVIKNYLFVEIVPGTERIEYYLDAQTGQFETGTCVKVNIYMGLTHKFEDMSLHATDSWPISWFKLTKVPEPPKKTYNDYERAMSVIGK